MSREDDFLKKRIQDLADQSYRTGQYTYTSFLTQSEQEIYYQLRDRLEGVESVLFGGAEGCDRQILRFGGAERLGCDAGFPVCCIEISPVQAKFSDQLTHRDYLGALMNLGIERSTIGDIMQREQCAYLFCLEKVAAYITGNLTQIKHTSVKCRRLEQLPDAVKPQRETVNLVAASMRLDVIVARLYHLSRSQSMKLFREKKVFVNGRQMQHGSGVLKEQDTVSVRGYGKFVCESTAGRTRKGNLNVRISRYI